MLAPDFTRLRGTPDPERRRMTPHAFYTGLTAAGWTFRVDPGGRLFVQPPVGTGIDDWHAGLIRTLKPALVAIATGQPWTAADHLRWLASTAVAQACRADGDEDVWEGIIAYGFRAPGVAGG